MFSDNGSNFKGAEKELRLCLESWNKNQIHDFLVQKAIRWHFNPPSAPHFGGIWERLVRSVKRSFRVILGSRVQM